MSGLKVDLSGRIALVTGASGQIGGAIATTLAHAGAAVGLHYRGTAPLATARIIQKAGGKAVCLAADFSATDFAAGLLLNITTALGAPNILINCAADQAPDQAAGGFDAMLHTNIVAVASLSRAFAALNQCDKAIVNISSIEARHPAPGHSQYGASKAGLENLTRAMAVELAPLDTRVNAVAPGLIARAGIKTDWPEGVARWQSACPMRRMGTADEVANAVAFLASPLAAWISGSILTLDGGTSASSIW